MIARAANHDDIPQLLPLYLELTRASSIGGAAHAAEVIDHPGTNIYVAEDGEEIRAMVTLHILPNVTWAGRPYALVENVVTQSNVHGQGYGRAALQAAIDAAQKADVYKIMLLTGQGRSARGFYEKLGFSADEKWGMTIRFE